MKILRRMIALSLSLASLTLFLAPAVARAEEDAPPPPIGEWQREAKLGVNLLQSYYTRNWNGADKGSIVWAANFDYLAQNQLTEKWNWRNTLNLAFGQTHQQDRDANGELVWRKPDKTTDLIQFESLFRYSLDGWDPYLSLDFESQFQDQTDASDRSIAFNPMKFTEAVGISRMLINQGDRQLMSRVGFAMHENSRKFFLSAPPDNAKKSYSSTDGGAELIFEYKDKILEDRVEYASKLGLYQPFFYSGKSDLQDLSDADLTTAGLPTDVADYTVALDADWENTFVTHITKVINVQLYLRWMYDKYDNTVKPAVENGTIVNGAAVKSAIRKAGQFKQTMSIGLAYTF